MISKCFVLNHFLFFKLRVPFSYVPKGQILVREWGLQSKPWLWLFMTLVVTKVVLHNFQKAAVSSCGSALVPACGDIAQAPSQNWQRCLASGPCYIYNSAQVSDTCIGIVLCLCLRHWVLRQCKSVTKSFVCVLSTAPSAPIMSLYLTSSWYLSWKFRVCGVIMKVQNQMRTFLCWFAVNCYYRYRWPTTKCPLPSCACHLPFLLVSRSWVLILIW